jgi:integrase/recombinase XerD
MKNKLTIRVILRKDKKKRNGRCPINYVLRLNGEERKLSTGSWIEPEDWDEKRSLPRKRKNLGYLEKRIRREVLDIEDFFNERTSQNREVTLDLLGDFYKGTDVYDFYTYFGKCVEKKSKYISEGTLKGYFGTLRALQGFRSRILINEINLKFIEQFEDYLLEKGTGEGGVWNRHKHFKAILEMARKEGVIARNPYELFTIRSTKSSPTYLNDDEILRLALIPWMSEKLELTRDRFLLSCYTGLRFSDINDLEWKHIIGTKCIRKTMVKTKKQVVIPLSDAALRLIDKYGEESSSKIFPRISNQKVNTGLKKLADMADIDKRLTFHVSRHTFGYQLGKSGTNAFYIMKLMGHSKISQSALYVNADIEDLESAMNNVPLFKAS